MTLYADQAEDIQCRTLQIYLAFSFYYGRLFCFSFAVLESASPLLLSVMPESEIAPARQQAATVSEISDSER